MTWIEVTLVGTLGSVLGASGGGPLGLIVYLLTTLVSIGVIFHNVNEFIKRWLAYELSSDPENSRAGRHSVVINPICRADSES